MGAHRIQYVCGQFAYHVPRLLVCVVVSVACRSQLVSRAASMGQSARWRDGPPPDGPNQLPDPRYTPL
jgi:hypothetical protein